MVNKDVAKGKVKQTKGEIKQDTGKLPNPKSQTGASKTCPSCENPRWDKTPRKS